MVPNRQSASNPPDAPLPAPGRRVRDRRFEALYMQSFIEMRARNAKR